MYSINMRIYKSFWKVLNGNKFIRINLIYCTKTESRDRLIKIVF